MKVRIAYTEEFPDDFRRAIRRYYGKEGLATRTEIIQWCRTFGDSMNDDLDYEEDDR